MTARHAQRGPRGPATTSRVSVVRHESADAAAGLVSLSFIGAAVHRRIRFWCSFAAVGVFLGLAIFVLAPPPYQASTSLFLTGDPTQNPVDSMQTDVALAQTRAVASRVVHDLGLSQSATKFLSTYIVVPTTDRIMTITVSAPTSSGALRGAATLATDFLSFRASQLKLDQRLVIQSLKQQIVQARQQLASDNLVLTRYIALPAASQQKAQLRNLRSTVARDSTVLIGLQDTVTNYPATTAQEIQGSQVINSATPVPRSRIRLPLQFVVAGLLAGLTLGLGIVVVGALVSDRLRRRDDVARALGAPVELSVGRIGAGLLRRRGLAAARGRDVQRIVAHLRGLVPDGVGGAPALAVVPVDDAGAAALAVVALGLSCAEQGARVLVADLTEGGLAARLLRAGGRGVQQVRVGGQQLTLAVPGELFPAGPLERAAGPAAGRRRGPAGRELMAAYAAADLLLTVATVDPAVGADHLGTWATDTVVTVTAGQSSATRIHAAAELIRLAGTRLVAAVLLDADKNDDSIGTGLDDPRPATPFD